ncbi:MAG: glycosyltransferase [Candidatus Hydrogenedentes bacterium]|nr:glycosyltransferase [Candidatus Hydrogenedentota bacterium]
MSSNEFDVSIVVPAYNQALLLNRLLDSITRQDYTGAVEVIVVEDCSPDNTGEIVQAWIAAHPAFHGKYLRHEVNTGPGKARNTGLHAACGRLIVFTDTDVVVQPQWLRELVAKIDPEQNIVGVGGRVLALHLSSPYARYNALWKTLEPPQPAVGPIPFLVTCNCCYLREALLSVGGFTEDIRTPGGEDIAASIMLFKKGYRFDFAENAVVYHDFRDTFKNFRRTWRNYGYGCALVAHRLLTPDELAPDGKEPSPGNYWPIHPIRPSVTGVRSTFYDLRIAWLHSRVFKLGFKETLESLFVRLVERYSFLYGWKQGIRRYNAEKQARITGQQP